MLEATPEFSVPYIRGKNVVSLWNLAKMKKTDQKQKVKIRIQEKSHCLEKRIAKESGQPGKKLEVSSEML